MVLAQGTDLLLLDEPTTFLAPVHEIDARDLHRQGGRTVVMVLHDLNLAARYADTMVAMRGGKVLAAEPPAEVLTPGLLREVFDLEAVVAAPVSVGPLIDPVGRAAAV